MFPGRAKDAEDLEGRSSETNWSGAGSRHDFFEGSCVLHLYFEEGAWRRRSFLLLLGGLGFAFPHGRFDAVANELANGLDFFLLALLASLFGDLAGPFAVWICVAFGRFAFIRFEGSEGGDIC